MARIFVSYNSSNREMAFLIGKVLKELGHAPDIHEWEIVPGGNIPAWMSSRIDQAEHVLCVVSGTYLEAEYSTVERLAAQWEAWKQDGFLIPVVVKRCTLPRLLAMHRHCDLIGLSEQEACRAFRTFMEGPKPPAAQGPAQVSTGQASVGASRALDNVPIRVPHHFLGRDDALAAIRTSLEGGTGRVAITALHGLRGVGKTTLAAVFAERHRAAYRATWWLRAQTPETLRADLAALGVALGWIARDEAEDPAVKAVLDRLRREGEGLLLIYDNAVDAKSLQPCLPLGGAAHILITSNDHAWREFATPIDIEVWPKQTGAAYFIARTGRAAERAEAEALSETLGGLPLAHEQAAAYCENLNISLAAYRHRFDKAPAQRLDDAEYAPAGYHDGLTVAKTFALAIDEAAKRHPAAEPLIVHAALLAPEPIPLFLFAEGREAFGEPLASALAGDGLDDALRALSAFALIDREAIPDERDPAMVTDSLRLHRLVRQVAAARCDDLRREAMGAALLGAMRSVYPDGVYNNPGTWPRARRLDPLALALTLRDGDAVAEEGPDAVHLLDRLATYRQSSLAAYVQARPLFERALSISKQVLGPEHSDTASSLNNLALLLKTQGDLSGARPLYERALAIREGVLGPEHPDTATSLNNLAGLLYAQGDLTGARPLYERALSIRERVQGPEHPDTATSLNNLALLLHTRGDLSRARPLYERALSIRERVLGPEHPDTATSLNNLAGLLYAQGDLSGARPLYERALSIRERVLGPEHPDTATSLNNLALLLKTQGDLSGARPLHERALSIRERVLGPEHPATATSLNNLASLLHAQGDLSGARPLHERALSIRERVLGPEHPDTKDSISWLAHIDEAIRRTGELAPHPIDTGQGDATAVRAGLRTRLGRLWRRIVSS